MKKMFDQSVIESDAFLDLPIEAQSLYIHLNFEGDADGFIENTTKTMRVCRVKRDSLDDLVKAGFLIRFKSGLHVITHWWVNNQMRRDRYTPTKHTAEKEMLMQGEDGEYILIEENKEKAISDSRTIPKNQEAMATALEADKLRYEDLGLSKKMADEARKWAKYKKERGEPLTETQLKSHVSSIKRYVQESSEDEVIKNMEDAISNGYKGVWGIKQARGRPEQKKAWHVEESNYDMSDLESRLLAN